LYQAARSRFQVITGRLEGDPEPFAEQLHIQSSNSVPTWRRLSKVIGRPKFAMSWRALPAFVFLLLPIGLLAAIYVRRAAEGAAHIRGQLAALEKTNPGWRSFQPGRQGAGMLVLSPRLRDLLSQSAERLPGNWLDGEFETVLHGDYSSRQPIPSDAIRLLRDRWRMAGDSIKRIREAVVLEEISRAANGTNPAVMNEDAWWKATRLLVTDAYAKTLDQHYSDAIASCGALLRLTPEAGADCRSAPRQFGWSRQNSCIDTALRLSDYVLAHGEVAEETLKSFQSLLESRSPRDIENHLRMERARVLWFLLNNPSIPADRHAPYFPEEVAHLDLKYNGVPGLPDLEELLFCAQTDNLDSQGWAIVQLLTECIDGTSTKLSAPTPRGWGTPLRSQLDYYLASTQQYALYYANLLCQIRATILAAALERYRLRHGSWPGKLESLVPEFIGSLPLGVFDGKPFVYKRLENGVVVYTVGSDKMDRGGSFARSRWYMGRNDIGVRLWDVSKRAEPESAKP
jgi:hypothetical protein